MRKIKTIAVVAALLMAGTIMTSCSKDESTNLVEKNQLTLKSASVMPDCETEFIVDNTPVFRTDFQTISWGGGKTPKSKTVTIEYGNNLTHFILKVTSTDGFSDLVINGISVWTGGPVADSVTATYSVLLPEGWERCDDMSYTLKVTGNGPQAVFAVEYALLDEQPCEEDFSYVANGDDSYTFYYTPEVDLNDVLVEFTFPQADNVDFGVNEHGFTNNGGGNSSVWSAIMDFTECETVSFTVILEGEGGRNLFTDFKVDNDSKKEKFNLANITMPK